MKILLLLCIAMATLLPGPAHAVYQLGDTVEDFTLLALDGSPVSLSEFSGKVVVINFFATWCPGCNDEVPQLEALYNTYEEDGLVILGVDLLEDPALVAPWVQSFPLTYPIVISPDWSLFQLFPQAGGFPYNAVLGRDGILRYGQFGINMEEITVLVQDLLLADPVATAPTTFDAVKALYR